MNRLTLKGYLTGFISSLVFTLLAYLFVTHQLVSRRLLIGVVAAFALAQATVQLIFFLHLGRQPKQRWRLVVLLFMLMVVAILVFGSLWIMYNLNYNQTPQQIYQYLNSQGDGI